MSDFEIVDGKLIKYTGKDDVVKIPDGVVEIGDNCFENSKIKNIKNVICKQVMNYSVSIVSFEPNVSL